MPPTKSKPASCGHQRAQVRTAPLRVICRTCGAWLGLGPSNDAIPRFEMKAALFIADLFLLWAPGRERTRFLNDYVNACATIRIYTKRGAAR